MRRALMLAAGTGVLLAGCGSSTHVVTTTQTVTAAASAASNEVRLEPTTFRTECRMYAEGNNASVTVYSSRYQVRPLCQQFERQQAAAAGMTWVNFPQSGSGTSADGVICDLHSAPGQAPGRIVVMDSGSATIGNEACQSFVAGGWLEAQ